MEKNQTLLFQVSAKLKTKPAELASRIETQLDEIRELKRAIDTFKARETAGEAERFLYGARTVSDLKIITATLPGADAGKLRQIGDTLRDKNSGIVAVMAGVKDEKITFLAVCGKDAVSKGIKAGDLVKLVCCCCGGSGGGKPDSAMGGGKDASKVDNALALVDDYVIEKLQ